MSCNKARQFSPRIGNPAVRHQGDAATSLPGLSCAAWMLATAAVLWSSSALSALTPDCPRYVWLGNNPSNSEAPDWSDKANGVANDGQHWFFTHETGVIKYTSDWYPRSGEDDAGKIKSIGIPEELKAVSINHLGDPDYYRQYLFVPLEGGGAVKAAIGVFRASDLQLVDWYDVTRLQPRAGWVAIDPVERMLYTSNNHLDAFTPLLRYGVDVSKIDNGVQGDFLMPYTNVVVRDYDGSELSGQFIYMQGGVFTPWGDLYLSVGKAGSGPSETRGGLHLLRRTADGRAFQLTQSSVNDSFPVGAEVFAYEYDPGSTELGEEPEGIDWWNKDNDPTSPYPGQLHAMLLDNQIDDSNIWLKHYRVDYFCVRNQDSDGDGVTDGDEVYVHNTHPLLKDADKDEVEDSIDNCPLVSNPDQSDLDGDGKGDPCDDDSDGDGQINAHELACGSDPMDSSSLAPDLDGDHVPDCVDLDDDGDGQTDADELACGSNPSDANSRSPDFDGDHSPDCLDQDDDNDAVADSLDACPATPLDLGTVRYAGCDSGVEDFLLSDPVGCSVSQHIQTLSTQFKSHGQFVSSVDKLLTSLQHQGLLQPQQKDPIKSCVTGK